MPVLTHRSPTLEDLRAQFLSILARIETHGRVYFRHLDVERREEAVAEMVALCWAWFVRLAHRGKDATQFASTLAAYAARAVHCGRKLAGIDRARDVLSSRAQQMHGFKVEHLPSSTRTLHEELYGLPQGQKKHDIYEERLRDNHVTPPSDAAAFRIDFRAWLQTLTGRERRIISAMALNERTKDLSRTFEVSPGRISQLRREFRDDWERFCSEPDEGTSAVV
jgi:hypothetical protein